MLACFRPYTDKRNERTRHITTLLPTGGIDDNAVDTGSWFRAIDFSSLAATSRQRKTREIWAWGGRGGLGPRQRNKVFCFDGSETPVTITFGLKQLAR